MLYSLSDAIQVATQIEEDILARSSHKLLHKIIDKGTSLMLKVLTIELLKIQSFPTQPVSQCSHISQGNQKWQQRQNRNLYECHLCGQISHLMAFCPNKSNRLANLVALLDRDAPKRVDEECYEPCYLVRPLLTKHNDDEEVPCNGQLCSMVIDSRSCSNAISKNVFRKLRLKIKLHPNPYKVAWVNNTSLKMNEKCLLTFSIGLLESRPSSGAETKGLRRSFYCLKQDKDIPTLSCIIITC
ncbi:hypothetical protein M9H77_20631 [Catharanthus roseus]|uniref:Uncharacterized protein n=1 Tax=Catharanthus roseus TaxID=4058 RepID=A0ACC0AMY7_CATRO|nr:hypothetical protein M9H77_20631 [Catharanthus roseus]